MLDRDDDRLRLLSELAVVERDDETWSPEQSRYSRIERKRMVLGL